MQLDLGLNLGIQNDFRKVLDFLSIQSSAAYSLRKLRNAYTGNAIRVRRSSDNVEADIGFRNGVDLDTTALLAHCGAGDGFVTTWYDQSGSNLNATQTTATNQPSIVTSGVINLDSGKPTILYDGIDDFFNIASAVNSSNISFNSVSKLGSKSLAANSSYILGATSAFYGYDNEGFGVAFSSTTGGYFNSPTPTTVRLSTAIDTVTVASNVASLFRFGTAIGAPTVTIGANFQPVFIGANVAGITGNWSGSMSEIVILSSTLSTTNRQLLERNQGLYFGITIA